MARGAAQDAAHDVAAVGVRGDGAVGHREGAGPGVVGDHLHRDAGLALGPLAGDLRHLVDHRREDVGLVVALLALQHGDQPLEAHAGVDALHRQRVQRAVGLAVELHEDVVPQLEPAVAAARADEAAGRVVALRGLALVVVDLGARAAGAGVGHRPEVLLVALRQVAQADDALGGQADLVAPDGEALVVILVYRDPQSGLVQAHDAGQELPAPDDGVALVVVAERPVAQHLEEGVVPGVLADLLEVIVLARHAHALLAGGGPDVVALLEAQEDGLELVHARVGEFQRRVIVGDQRRRGHDRVPAFGEKREKTRANVPCFQGRPPLELVLIFVQPAGIRPKNNIDRGLPAEGFPPDRTV